MEAGTITPEQTETPGDSPGATPNGAGQGDFPGEAADEGQQPTKAPAIELEGRGTQMTLDVGGEPPTKATVKLRGGSIGIPKGQYDKGETVNLLVTVRCDAVALIDKHDNSTGAITEVERRHAFSITDVQKVD